MSSSWQLMAFGMFCAMMRWPMWSGASSQKTGQILKGNTSFAFVFPSKELRPKAGIPLLPGQLWHDHSFLWLSKLPANLFPF